MVQESGLNMDWFPCREPGCTAPSQTLYQWDAKAVGFDGSDTVVYYERRYCLNGHYLDVEVFDDFLQ